jgi:soluble lytic murein transglycosylase-like protein
MDDYDSYDSPLLDHSNYSAGSELLVYDSVRQIQIRMVFIFGLALMVASTLSLLSLPVQVDAGSGGSFAAAPVTLESASQQDDQIGLQEISPSNGSEIANLFTPEVHYWEAEIVKWANQHDVDPNAVATIMQIESCGNPQAVSVAGARGLFQVMPFHFGSNENMLDPDTNARRGLDFLNEQLRYTGGDIFLSFAGYNGGYAASGGNYDAWPNETKRYYQWAKGIYQDASSGATSSETLNTWLDAGGRPGCQQAASLLGI